jgi:glucose/arabinose dehydrogenase
LTQEIAVPAGFQAQVFADGVGPARHIVSRANGDIFVILSSPVQGHCLVALRDANRNGRAEQLERFGGNVCGTGLAIDGSFLYYASGTDLWRVALPSGGMNGANGLLVPTDPPQRLVKDLGSQSQHNARSLALDGKGFVYVNVGAPSNACQAQDRRPGSPGQDPCPLLTEFGGIWRFKTDQLEQTKATRLRYATGIRNAVALDWHPVSGLHLAQHGRDQLDTLYPQLYTSAQNAELPAEEFAQIQSGDDLGWPTCYFDPLRKQKVLGPEYGGDGQKVGRCAAVKAPLIGFPAHYAPNDLLFYTGSAFPEKYQGGAMIAFHGSWNRGDQQEGYQVVFVPFDKQGQYRPVGSGPGWEVFADGFAGSQNIRSPGEAKYRPMGLAQAADGGLMVVDSVVGRLWRISVAKP